MESLGAAVVGCGNVSGAYAEALTRSARFRLVGATSRTPDRATAFAGRFGGRVYSDLDELLGDDDVDVVVNLTTQAAHADVTSRCLEAAKHVYSEKPLALEAARAQELADMADARGVRLSCAFSTFLAPPQQEAIRLVRSGRLGSRRVRGGELGPHRDVAPEP